jgi:hypothetical protein
LETSELLNGKSVSCVSMEFVFGDPIFLLISIWIAAFEVNDVCYIVFFLTYAISSEISTLEVLKLTLQRIRFANSDSIRRCLFTS